MRSDLKGNLTQLFQQQVSPQSSMSVQQRCNNILNYWLDVELFDLPECPFKDQRYDILSVEAYDFATRIQEQLIPKIIAGQVKITAESRLCVMFQCHRAGYIADLNHYQPNQAIPRTYLVAHSFIPHWDADQKVLTWSLSQAAEDLVINLATIRTLYRKCPSSAAHNMSLSAWITSRLEDIENLFRNHFPTNHAALDLNQLQKQIKLINRALAVHFWPEKSAKDFMLQYAQSLDSSLEEDQPQVLPDNQGLTFRWRFSFYPEVNDQQQLGPFYAKDLESCIEQLRLNQLDGLSEPLKYYLLGKKQQKKLPDPIQNGEFYWSYFKFLSLGRWPSPSQYGLNLLQSFAVKQVELVNHPIVAVNGPPGTGKTTLLKDIIANRFTLRMRRLYDYLEQPDWLTNPQVHKIIMDSSMLVASSNNKAVENISKELPDGQSIDPKFVLQHFKEIAGKNEWGLFCGVLGNAQNRKDFKQILYRLKKYLYHSKDILHLNRWVTELKHAKDNQERVSSLEAITKFWLLENLIEHVIKDIQQCSNYKRHQGFFDAFFVALPHVSTKKLALSDFLSHWEKLSEEEWQEIIAALESVKKQWFAKKMYKPHQVKRLMKKKGNFAAAFNILNSLANDLQKNNLSDEHRQAWELETEKHLYGEEAYKFLAHEDIQKKLEQLHTAAPLGSEKVNEARSLLFRYALELNQEILEQSAEQLEPYWSDLDALIDGTLESNEKTPYHQQLWSILFSFFPVLSSSLSSIQSQFKLMQHKGGFGLGMLDEAGQAVNYHVAGLLQRCEKVIFVGDPIQLEPVCTMPTHIDQMIAKDYLPLAQEYGQTNWGDDYVVSQSSAQILADKANYYFSEIGQRKIGIPLLVHRRCLEPMFSIANQIAYDNKMLLATAKGNMQERKFLASGWINVTEQAEQVTGKNYANQAESKVALQLIQYLTEHHTAMIEGGVFIITPFTGMKKALVAAWKQAAKRTENHAWMRKVLVDKSSDINDFAYSNIGTVHTFQGKEASTVILCTAASQVRNKMGGIKWVNSKPNLLNVALTRAKHHFFVIGNQKDWQSEKLSVHLQTGKMHIYPDFDSLTRSSEINYKSILEKPYPLETKNQFYFGV